MSSPRDLSPEQQEGLSRQREALARAGSLLQSPDFQWFLEECLEEKIKATQEKALALTTDDETCRVMRSLRAMLLDVREWPEMRLKVAREYIKSVDGGTGPAQ